MAGQRLILASASASRARMLEAAGVPVEVGDIEQVDERDWFPIPEGRRYLIGAVDLRPLDAWYALTAGVQTITAFAAESGRYVTILGQGDEPMSPADLRRAYAEPGSMERVWSGLRHLADNLHRVPALVIPCIEGRAEHLALPQQASHFGSILPAVWSFLLAARAHGLGTVWTTGNLAVEREVAELLGIPYDEVMQVALIPVAHTKGTAFRPAHRVPVDEVLHWNRW